MMNFSSTARTTIGDQTDQTFPLQLLQGFTQRHLADAETLGQSDDFQALADKVEAV